MKQISALLKQQAAEARARWRMQAQAAHGPAGDGSRQPHGGVGPGTHVLPSNPRMMGSLTTPPGGGGECSTGEDGGGLSLGDGGGGGGLDTVEGVVGLEPGEGGGLWTTGEGGGLWTTGEGGGLFGGDGWGGGGLDEGGKGSPSAARARAGPTGWHYLLDLCRLPQADPVTCRGEQAPPGATGGGGAGHWHRHSRVVLHDHRVPQTLTVADAGGCLNAVAVDDIVSAVVGAPAS